MSRVKNNKHLLVSTPDPAWVYEKRMPPPFAGAYPRPAVLTTVTSKREHGRPVAALISLCDLTNDAVRTNHGVRLFFVPTFDSDIKLQAAATAGVRQREKTGTRRLPVEP